MPMSVSIGMHHFYSELDTYWPTKECNDCTRALNYATAVYYYYIAQKYCIVFFHNNVL